MGRVLSGLLLLGLQDGRGKQQHQSGAYMGHLEPAPLSPDTLMHPADSDSRSAPFHHPFKHPALGLILK